MNSPAPQLSRSAPGFFRIPFLVLAMLYQRFSHLPPCSLRVGASATHGSRRGGRDTFNEPTGPNGERLRAEGRPCKYFCFVSEGRQSASNLTSKISFCSLLVFFHMTNFCWASILNILCNRTRLIIILHQMRIPKLQRPPAGHVY